MRVAHLWNHGCQKQNGRICVFSIWKPTTSNSRTVWCDYGCRKGVIKKIERRLELKKFSSTDCFLVGSAASATDFALFEMLNQYTCLIRFFWIDCLWEQKPCKDSWSLRKKPSSKSVWKFQKLSLMESTFSTNWMKYPSTTKVLHLDQEMVVSDGIQNWMWIPYQNTCIWTEFPISASVRSIWKVKMSFSKLDLESWSLTIQSTCLSVVVLCVDRFWKK